MRGRVRPGGRERGPFLYSGSLNFRSRGLTVHRRTLWRLHEKSAILRAVRDFDRLNLRIMNGDTATNNWLQVAMLIVAIITAAATVVGPLLSVFVQVRISQPNPSPEANQPKKRTRRVYLWLARRASWFVCLGMLFNGYLLYEELSKSTPIDRYSVLLIATGMAGLALQCAVLFILQVVRIMGLQLEIMSLQSEINKDIVSAIEEIHSSVFKLAPVNKKPPESALDKLLRKLTGG